MPAAVTDASMNKDLVRAFIREVWNTGDVEAATRYMDERSLEFSSVLSCQGRGYLGIRHFVQRFRAAFPDIRFHILQMVAENEKVAVHFVGIGTHGGEYMGTARTGRPVDVIGAALCRIVDGKIIEIDQFIDELSLRAQLNAPEAQAFDDTDLATGFRQETKEDDHVAQNAEGTRVNNWS
jgi:predicted ester cyclase